MENYKKTEKVNKIIVKILTIYDKVFKNYKYVNNENQPVKLCIDYKLGYIFQIYKIDHKYILNFRLLDNIKYNKNKNNKKACMYCKDHCGDLVFTCCNNTFNYSCGLQNAFECKCSLKKSELINNNKIEECSVCLENTNLKTRCNHILCDKCLTSIKLSNNLSLTCPLCRDTLSIYSKCIYKNLYIKLINNKYINCDIYYIE